MSAEGRVSSQGREAYAYRVTKADVEEYADIAEDLAKMMLARGFLSEAQFSGL